MIRGPDSHTSGWSAHYGAPTMKLYEDYVRGVAKNAGVPDIADFSTIYEMTKEVADGTSVALFIYTDGTVVGRCCLNKFTWHTSPDEGDKSPLWTRMDYIWSVTTDNIVRYTPDAEGTETIATPQVIWLCIALAHFVWSRVEVHKLQ